jgi:transposase InsO family protein
MFSLFFCNLNLVENQFSCSIKQFQCDGGGEYMSTQFKKKLVTHGILHHISCPHTPQQNGVAECKHRHIMEMRLSLLAQSHLSSIFWVDTFATSVFIINRLPSPIIDNVSPYFKLFNKSPYYSPFRSFGCSCFPLLRPYSTHKLMFRSKHCIFLGYSNNHRGYRYLDPISRKVYVSRHVVFDESRFPAENGVLSPATPGSVSSVSFPIFSPDTTC